MIETTTHKRLYVSTDGGAGPYLMLPVAQRDGPETQNVPVSGPSETASRPADKMAVPMSAPLSVVQNGYPASPPKPPLRLSGPVQRSPSSARISQGTPVCLAASASCVLGSVAHPSEAEWRCV
jgi:hypothetical protein